ncbi:MAG: putative transport system ATP-binding protein [Chloroflexia bacterium]|jgi:putative ABC transport system ATP-binding protein|nr:putative transport system ATP-binding protein [Chloroflexia bacterium]
MIVLHAADLYRFYHTGEDETLALRGVSLDLHEGELVAVMGPSGSGKSTLLACLAGLDEPDGGHVEILGTHLTRRPESQRAAMRAANIGILLQSGNLFDHLSVDDNILLQMHLAHKISRRRLDELVDLVDLSKRRRARPSQLSGGEAARAGLAVALAASPRVLLADEPTGEVDAETEARILNIFESRRGEGDVTLIATHSDALAARADRIVRLEDGRVVHD